jgi:hypothetical protein
MQPIKPRHWRWPIALAAVFVPGIATGALTLPHVFTPGTPIRAAEVNANFEAIRQQSDSIEAGLANTQSSVSTLQGQVNTLLPLQGRVTTLEGQVSALQLQVNALQNLVSTKLTAGHTFSYVDTDQGIVGTASNNIFVATPTASRIVTPATSEPGTYMLVWYAEYGRTNNGGGNRVLARLRNVTQNTTVAISRRTQGIENTSVTVLPPDNGFGTAGDVLEFSGAITLQLTPGPTQTFELQYAINNNANSGAVIRVQRQRLDLVRVF